jgi:hypothetical protein
MRPDAHDWSVLLVQFENGASSRSFPVFVGKTPFCRGEEFGAWDMAERAEDEGIEEDVLDEEHDSEHSCRNREDGHFPTYSDSEVK